MLYWVLCLALFAEEKRIRQFYVTKRKVFSVLDTVSYTNWASSASQQDVGTKIQPANITVLQTFPSIVQIDFYLFWSTIDWSQECAGSILTSRFVLSAASCFSGWSFELRFRRVRAGSTSRNTGGNVLYIQDIVNHPRWYERDYSGDVSVVRLFTPLVYSPVIQQASIASPSSWIPNNLRLSQPGWGRHKQPVLSSLQVVTAPRSSCGRRDGNFSLVLNTTQNILCALPVGFNVTSNDDVGGPWIFDGVTVGIVGGLNALDVYSGLIGAEVSRYTEWIVNVVARGI